MAKLRLNYEEKVLCGLALDPGFSAKEKPAEDEAAANEMLVGDGFVESDEIGPEHVAPNALSESQLEACMDPLEYAVRPRDPELYGPKTLARNLRLF